MDYHQLLDGICEMGCRLLGCGAEIPRVEDTVRRLAAAYETYAEVFAIPNCLIVSITDSEGKTLTKMRQASINGTDIETLEALNALSRRLCANPPADAGEILTQVKAVSGRSRPYSLPMVLLGFFIGAAFFAVFYSGTPLDALVGGCAGVLAGACDILLKRHRSNFFINTTASGFVLAFVAYAAYLLGVPLNMPAVIAGGIMVLVPGLVFTNFMSDLLTGDIVAGLSTFTRAVLTAGAIALGSGSAIGLLQHVDQLPVADVPPFMSNPVLACITAFIACLGFCMPFAIKGRGMLLCCLGGALGWGMYLLFESMGCSVYLSTFAASVAISIYAEVMARLRKCPTTAYLVVSYFPLVPGFTIYTAMAYGIRGDIDQFLSTFIRTFGLAGCIALGTLTVSTAVQILHTKRRK